MTPHIFGIHAVLEAARSPFFFKKHVVANSKKNMSAKRLRLDALCAELCGELSTAAPSPTDLSVVQIRGWDFRQILDGIEIAKFKIEHTDTLVKAMAAPCPIGYSQNIMAFSTKKSAINELFWLNHQLLNICPWSEKTHGSFDENDRLVAFVLGMFRISEEVEWKIVSLLELWYLFKALCPSSVIDKETTGIALLEHCLANPPFLHVTF